MMSDDNSHIEATPAGPVWTLWPRIGRWVAGTARPPHPDCLPVSVTDLRAPRAKAARLCRAGVLNAEPGGGRASGAAQRRRP